MSVCFVQCMYISAKGDPKLITPWYQHRIFQQLPNGGAVVSMQGGVCQACDQCQFLAKQLQLFGKLCKGNNPYTIARCESYHVTFSEALLCAQDQSFQPELRSEYVKLIKGM